MPDRPLADEDDEEVESYDLARHGAGERRSGFDAYRPALVRELLAGDLPG